MCCTDCINQMRNELHRLIESEDNLKSSIVQKKSRELDNLILMYYRRDSKLQKSNDP
jgi:hypothetical protein